MVRPRDQQYPLSLPSQDSNENSVDLGHLNYVHGYDKVGRAERLSVDGHMLTSRFEFTSVRRVARIAMLTFDLYADTIVAVHEKSIGMDMSLWVLATPIDGTLIDMTLVSQVREISETEAVGCGFGFPPYKDTRTRHEQVLGLSAA